MTRKTKLVPQTGQRLLAFATTIHWIGEAWQEFSSSKYQQFIDFLRDIVLAPKAPMMHEFALMTSSTLSNLGH